MDYGVPEKRKTKGDKRAKARYSKYKRGGGQRSANVSMSGKKKDCC